MSASEIAKLRTNLEYCKVDEVIKSYVYLHEKVPHYFVLLNEAGDEAAKLKSLEDFLDRDFAEVTITGTKTSAVKLEIECTEPVQVQAFLERLQIRIKRITGVVSVTVESDDV